MSAEIVVKWSGQEFVIPVDPEDTVEAVKRKIQDKTNVAPKRQKLLGLKAKGKLAQDDSLMSDVKLKPGQKVMMMGTPEEVIESTSKQVEEAPEIADDFDLDPEDEKNIQVTDRPETQEKLKRRVESVEVKIMNPPREGKKLLVLDIDYTIFDLGGSAERPEELARPYLHEFMTACYQHYDLVIWSATSMKWVEVKMKELGVSTHPDYKITFMLDHSAMVTVHTEKYGVFDCKPLAFLWAKFPDFYNESNTVMLDDLRRNFIMNRQNGLVIRPFAKSHRTRHTDRELLRLKRYLTFIGTRESLSDLNHRRWESFLAKNRTREQ
ncbi:hypothetical protein BSKO_13948 [Bryopsis sp. KO-2023]|nr:hypothetical protein BSKO_13948 [Bryopsis sp. KO-2023]